MSAASPKIQDKAQEPSMEEILASIRRIIADDQAPKPEPEPEAPVARLLPEPEDILDLAEVARPVRKPEPVPFDVPEIDLPEIDFREEEVAFEPPPPPPPPPAPKKAPERLQAAIQQEAVERLVSKATDDSVGQSFNLLAQTVLSRNARTLEDLVAEMLRPMLQDWLDENLPGMVERLVKAEIERVARGR